MRWTWSFATAVALTLTASRGQAQSDDVLERAQRTCTPGASCGEFVELARRAQAGDVRAIAMLAQIQDPRSANVLAHIVIYGATLPQRSAADAALNRLASTETGRTSLVRIRDSRLDAEVAKAAADYLDAATPPGGARAPSVQTDSRAEAQARTQVRPDDGARRASEPHRAVYTPTAILRSRGQVSWASYNLGFHSVDVGVTKNLEVGMQALIPVGAFGFLPRFRVGFSPAKNVHLAVTGTGGVLGTYVEQVNGVGLGGGGPVLTLGDERMFLNISAQIYGGSTFSDAVFGLGDDTFWAALPSVGFSRRLSRSVRLNVELYKPLSPNFDDNAAIWAVLYGVRIFGDQLYGDVSFIVPIYSGADDLLKYAPLGLPLLVFGYRWGS